MQHQFTISVSTDFYLHTLYISGPICNTAKCYYWLSHVCPSAWNNSAPIGRIVMKFDIWEFFEIISRKFEFLLTSGKNNEHSCEYIRIFMTKYIWILLKMKIVLDKLVEKIKTHTLFSMNFFSGNLTFWRWSKKNALLCFHCKSGYA